jgi:hypothetical protein
MILSLRDSVHGGSACSCMRCQYIYVQAGREADCMSRGREGRDPAGEEANTKKTTGRVLYMRRWPRNRIGSSQANNYAPCMPHISWPPALGVMHAHYMHVLLPSTPPASCLPPAGLTYAPGFQFSGLPSSSWHSSQLRFDLSFNGPLYVCCLRFLLLLLIRVSMNS